MSILLEVVWQFVLEIVAFAVGRVFVFLFMPWRSVESVRDPQREDKHWKWRGVSLPRDGKRELSVEAVQLIGLAVIAAGAISGWWFSR